MRQTDFRPSALPIPLALILAIGASPSFGQFTAIGPQNIGCATPPITLIPSGYTLSPSPAGYGSVIGFFLLWIPPPAPVPIYSMPSSSSFGSSGGCCNPGPSTIYSFDPSIILTSPTEVGVFPYSGSLNLDVWVQEVMWRPAAPFNPCTMYVTNQVFIHAG